MGGGECSENGCTFLLRLKMLEVTRWVIFNDASPYLKRPFNLFHTSVFKEAGYLWVATLNMSQKGEGGRKKVNEIRNSYFKTKWRRLIGWIHCVCYSTRPCMRSVCVLGWAALRVKTPTRIKPLKSENTTSWLSNFYSYPRLQKCQLRLPQPYKVCLLYTSPSPRD